jgi:serine/threonine protein phosphatase PrpC
VEEAEIQRTVTEHPPAAACATLIALARERGGPDNISLHVLRLARA